VVPRRGRRAGTASDSLGGRLGALDYREFWE